MSSSFHSTKKCCTCNKVKSHEAFSKKTSSKDGLQSSCKTCNKIQAKRYVSTEEGYLTVLLLETREFARKKRLTFQLTKEDVNELWSLQEGKCALTRSQLVYTRGSPFSLTLDRLNYNDGFVRCNVQLVCWAVNPYRLGASHEEIYRLCSNITEFHEGLSS